MWSNIPVEVMEFGPTGRKGSESPKKKCKDQYQLCPGMGDKIKF
jgi:hypothetical protein